LGLRGAHPHRDKQNIIAYPCPVNTKIVSKIPSALGFSVLIASLTRDAVHRLHWLDSLFILLDSSGDLPYSNAEHDLWMVFSPIEEEAADTKTRLDEGFTEYMEAIRA